MAELDKGDMRAKSSFGLRLRIGLVGLLVLAVPAAIWLWPEQEPPAAPSENEMDAALAAVNPGYVGIDACSKCHARRVQVVKTTRHYLACLRGNGVAAPGFKPGRGRCDTRFSGLHYEMTRAGADCFATAVKKTAQGEERTKYKIGLVYGSASKRDEMYFTWKDDRLLRIPVAWLYPLERWGTDVDDLRVLDTHPSCLECHNTWVGHVPGNPIRYRRKEMFLGVTCERCHGPGREHVEYHEKNPQQKEAHGILHPGTLSRERLIDVCAQCHANTRMLRSPFAYRPGQPLEKTYRIAKAKYREDDTTTNQVQYLSESECFKKSKMTCITCHDPHRPTSARSGCMLCHTAASCIDQPKQPVAVRDDCVGCHMPEHIWMNSHFYTTKNDNYLPVAPRSEHRIAIYPEAKKAVILAWLRTQKDAKSRAGAKRLAAELTKYWLKRADERLAANRFKSAIGAFREALQIAPDPATQMRMNKIIVRQTKLDDLIAKATEASRRNPDEAIRLLTQILDIRPDDAPSHNKLGTIYALTGRRDKAIRHLRAVAEHDPYNSSGVTRLAWMANVEGRLNDALALCTQADKIEPEHPGNQFVWGMVLAKQRRWVEAEKRFRKTLAGSVTHVGANQALSEALRRQGKSKEAIQFARRAVRWSDSKDPEALLTLAEAYQAARRVPDARKTLEKALAIVGKSNPPMADAIRKRLQELP